MCIKKKFQKQIVVIISLPKYILQNAVENCISSSLTKASLHGLQ